MQQKPPPSSWSEDEELDVLLVILRSALRWKQNDLADASGIGNSSISDYERRKKVPGRKNLRKLLDAMGYQPGVLDFTRRFLHELRTAQRLNEGDGPDAHDGAEHPPSAEAALLARVEQVSSEAGRAAESVVRLALEIELSRDRPKAEG